MEWVAISATIARDPSVHRMAGALRVRVPEVVGLLALTFAEMSQHAPDGNVGDVPDTLLETWSGWHGKKGAFAAQFRGTLCNHAGLVLAWEKYNGANIRRAKASRERARTWRERKENAHENANRTRTETVTVQTTGQDKTGQNKKEKEKSGADAPARAVKIVRPPRSATSAWASEGVAWWEQSVGDMKPPLFEKALVAMVARHGWPAVFADLQRWVGERKRAGKQSVPKWYAEVASARLSAPPAPAIVDEFGCLTEYGERITRPDKVPA